MRLTGTTPLVEGQQSYAIVFTPAFAIAPLFFPTVEMPNDSGEVFYVSADLSTLNGSGVTVWLSGIPTAASAGGRIVWEASMPTGSPLVVGPGMTVPQLFHRIARRSRTGDFTKLDMTEQTDLMEAANVGLQRLYNALPVYFKELTEGFVLPAPITLAGVAVTQFSKNVTANTFTSAQLGATVQLDGDPQWNQVASPSTLLNAYMGATGTVGGTVYGDALFSDIYPLDRIIGNPTFPNNNWALGPLNIMNGQAGGPYGAWLYQQSVGIPRTWWVQTFGNSQGHAPFVVLKFAPLPDIAYPVDVRISFWPKRLTLADYQQATTLVVPTQFLDTCLVPLCLEAFMTSPAWKERGDEDRVWQKAQDAEAYLRMQPGTIGSPSNRIGTPIGF